MQAMILAAGLGTRLLPYTNIKPKPLFPILNRPLLLLTIERLLHAGCDHIIINCHHLREQIVEAVRGYQCVVVQQEEIILGTGGGLRKALSLMRDEPLLITNGDIYHSLDFGDLFTAHEISGAEVTMAMHDYPRFNGVTVDGKNMVSFEKNADGKKLAFTGLHVINPQVLATLREDEPSCIIGLYKQMLTDKKLIEVYRADNCFWTDMGTPEDYLELHAGLLAGSIPAWPELHYNGLANFVVNDQARLTGNIRYNDWCAIGAAAGHDLHLSRVVVWDGVQLPDGFTGTDMIIASNPAAD